MDALLNDQLAVVTQGIMAKAGYAAPSAGQQDMYTLHRHRSDPGAIDASEASQSAPVVKDLKDANDMRAACTELTPEEFDSCLKAGEGLAWPDKYRSLVVAVRSKRMVKVHASRTPEEKAETSKNQSKQMVKAHARNGRALSKKISKSMAARTPEEKAETSKKMSVAHASRTPEEKAEKSKKFSKSMAARTPEEKAETSKKIRKARAERTPEEKAETGKQIRKARAERTPFTDADDQRIRQLVNRFNSDHAALQQVHPVDYLLLFAVSTG